MTHDTADDVDTGKELLELLKYVLVGINALLFIAAAFMFATSPRRAAAAGGPSINVSGSTAATKHALLVTAHPDDESMFFLPLVHSLTQRTGGSEADEPTPEWQVHLLCLSRGNFDGLGAVREQEMVTCGQFLGIAKENIHVLEDPQLQDGMQATWSHAHIATLVLESIERHRINAVRLRMALSVHINPERCN